MSEAENSTNVEDIVYDLVSVQYHALKGGQLVGKFLQDAKGNAEVTKFLKSIQKQDRQRAEKAHELLAQLTKEGI